MDTHMLTNAIAPASDLTGPAHRPPKDAFVTNPTQQPNTTLVLDLVAEHLPHTEDCRKTASASPTNSPPRARPCEASGPPLAPLSSRHTTRFSIICALIPTLDFV